MISISIGQKSDRSTSVAMGLFDGVHKGHLAVIEEALLGKKEGLVPAVFTFDTTEGLPSTKRGGLIYSSEYKEYILESLGVELLCAVHFDVIKDLSPEAFVDEILVGTLKAARVVCGGDFRFGRHAAGGTEELKTLCEARGIALVVVPQLVMDGAPVSSTRIRKLIEDGQIEDANRLCGREYGIVGTVLRGRQLGRAMGFPTINQRLQTGRTLPRFGVYRSETILDGKSYPSITNIGIKPTVGSDEPLSETNIFGFSGDLYGRRVLVKLTGFIRPERKFQSVEELKMQMEKDIGSVLGH